MSQQEQFEQMLLAMASPDNVERKAAEAAYEQTLASDPVWLMIALVEVGVNSENPTSAQLALVMLRKLFNPLHDESSVFAKCTAEQQATTKSQMLAFFGNTHSRPLRRAVASCISALACLLSTKARNAWPELWPALLTAMSDPTADAQIRSACCEIFAQVSAILASTYLKHHLLSIVNALSVCIGDSDYNVRKSAFETVAAFAAALTGKQIAPFRRLAAPMIQHAVEAAADRDSDLCTELVGQLAGMAETCDEIYEGAEVTLLEGMMAIASDPHNNGEARRVAIECIMQFIEMKPKAMRRVKDFVKSLFNLLFEYLLHPTIEDDWLHTYEETNEANAETDFDVACTSMDRLAQSLGGKAVQAVATDMIMASINSTEWNARGAALTTLTYIIEGCRKQFEEHLGSIITGIVLPKFDDPHPYVRYCAIQCVAQCCTDFSPQFQINFAESILPAVARVLLSDEAPRLQALCAGTLNNFYDEIEEDDPDVDDEDSENKFLIPYYQGVMESLYEALTKSSLHFVRYEILSAMGSVMQVGKAHMTPFVGHLTPIFHTILQEAEVNSEVRTLKCKAMECVTLLACGVGKEAFGEAACHNVCQYLLEVLSGGLANDDPRLRYVLRGWTCMVEALKGDVLQYMPGVMPPLLAVANLDCDMEIVPTEVGEEDDDDEEGVFTQRIVKHGEGEAKMRMHTSLVEDKNLAVTILLTIVDYLRGLALPYLKDITNCCVDCLDFAAYSEVRESAAQALGLLALSYQEASPEFLGGFLNHVAPKLLMSVQSEPEPTVASEMLKAFSCIIDACPDNSFAPNYVEDAANLLWQVFNESVKRIKDANGEKADLDEDVDEDDAEALDAEVSIEHDLLADVLDAVGKIMKKSHGFVVHFTTQYLPIVHELLGEGTKPAEHALALGSLCDYLEYAGPTAMDSLDLIAGAMLHNVTSQDEAVCQSAFFGVGLIAMRLAEHFPQPHGASLDFVQSATAALRTYLSGPRPKKKSNYGVTANAVSSTLRLIDNFGALVPDTIALFQLCVPLLPVKVDKIEAEKVHETIVWWATVEGHPVMSDPRLRAPALQAISKSKFLNAATKQALETLGGH